MHARERLCSAISSSVFQQIELIVVLIHHWAFIMSTLKGLSRPGAVVSSSFFKKSDLQLARYTPTAKRAHDKGVGAEQGCVLGHTKEAFIPLLLYGKQHCQKHCVAQRTQKGNRVLMSTLAAVVYRPVLRPCMSLLAFRLHALLPSPWQLSMGGWRVKGSRESTCSDPNVPPEEHSVQWLSNPLIPHSLCKLMNGLSSSFSRNDASR